MDSFPCKDCVLMAMCNAKMHKKETSNGINAFDLRNECKILNKYLEQNHSTFIDKTTMSISLMPVHKFFMNTYQDTFYFTDNLENNIKERNGPAMITEHKHYDCM